MSYDRASKQTTSSDYYFIVYSLGNPALPRLPRLFRRLPTLEHRETKFDTTYPILYRSRRQKERELKGNYNQISLLNQILVKGEIDHKSTTTRIS